MTYGLELLDMNNKQLQLIEVAHQSMAKKTQGLPMSTANCCALAPIGWKSISATLMIKSLTMMWQILLLPMNSVYKLILVNRLLEHNENHGGHGQGPAWKMFTDTKSLSLLNTVMSSITTGNYMSMSEWKRTVKSRVCEYEHKKWTMACCLYRSLRLYREIFMDISMWPWWSYAYAYPRDVNRCKVLLRIATTDRLLHHDQADKDDASSSLCNMCGCHTKQDAAHLLFSCTAQRFSTRQKHWDQVQLACPPNLYSAICKMVPRRRLSFILTGFNSQFIPEWANMYSEICTFICKMQLLAKIK